MKHAERHVRTIDLGNAVVALRDDGIIHVYVNSGTTIDVDLQYEMVKAFFKLSDGVRTGIIYEGGEFISITKEARENALTMDNTTPTAASAIIVANLAQKILAEFYYRVHKPSRPYSIFTDFDKGIAWLQSLKK